MIINIRGTSGTGKSTAMRAVMEHFGNDSWSPFHKEGRRQPLYLRNFDQKIVVLGHYNAACGGCDTINSYEEIYNLVGEQHHAGNHVLFEGLLISGEARRPIDIHLAHLPIHVLAIQLPIEDAIASVNTRRWSKNPDKPGVNPKNTIAKARAVELAMKRLEEAGVPAEWVTRENVVQRVVELLNVG